MSSAAANIGVWPTTIPGVINFAQVSANLCRGAQPTPAGFKTLKQRGIRTVLDLREEEDDSVPLKGTGSWRYYRIRESAFDVESSQTLQALKVMTHPVNWPVFVHCLHGSDRTGLTIACYRMFVEGWTNDQAIAELPRFGYHKMFVNILWYLKHFDVNKARVRLPAAREPCLQLVS
jgi:protein tyrosine/serine phosphatase